MGNLVEDRWGRYQYGTTTPSGADRERNDSIGRGGKEQRQFHLHGE